VYVDSVRKRAKIVYSDITSLSQRYVVQLDHISVFDTRFREEQAFVAVVTPEMVSVGDQVVDLFLRRGVHPFRLV